ncbi:helix-turn-helix transcriptional regulator [Arsenicicoccus cauae]|uniref:WYL domain-containing protein n=1 Tax=Arsenicicoccus cauae TaxID=2663847 RepID=A0A6I3ICE6_9MICO|nr:YafY family protein [Arsenicicoccus cauae]MTB71592.1 WYL domain-containing protein [Arsenicicoccus cauae]
MADTTARALRLLSLLQSRPVWTGPDLVAELHVTDRTLRRDVQRLRDLGYRVESAAGTGGGYRLVTGRELPPLLLDDDEAVALAVSLRLATQATVEGIGDASVRALGKLEQVMPAPLRERVAALQETTVMLAPGGAQVDVRAVTDLATAARGRVQVRFSYVKRGGEVGERRVEPYHLVVAGRRWYLFAWDLDRDDWRVFRVDRTSDVHVTTWRFTPRPCPDPAGHVQRSIGTGGYRWTVVVRLGAPAEEVREHLPPAAGTVEADGPDVCVVTVGANDLPMAAWYLMNLAEDVQVISPPELRDAFAQLGARAQRAASVPLGDGARRSVRAAVGDRGADRQEG